MSAASAGTATPVRTVIDPFMRFLGERLAQREEAMWAMKLDILSRLHVAEQVREESAFYAIDAEIEAVAPGCRGDGVSSCLLLAVRVVGDCGDELARYEIK